MILKEGLIYIKHPVLSEHLKKIILTRLYLYSEYLFSLVFIPVGSRSFGAVGITVLHEFIFFPVMHMSKQSADILIFPVISAGKTLFNHPGTRNYPNSVFRVTTKI